MLITIIIIIIKNFTNAPMLEPMIHGRYPCGHTPMPLTDSDSDMNTDT